MLGSGNRPAAQSSNRRAGSSEGSRPTAASMCASARAPARREAGAGRHDPQLRILRRSPHRLLEDRHRLGESARRGQNTREILPRRKRVGVDLEDSFEFTGRTVKVAEKGERETPVVSQLERGRIEPDPG